MAHGLHVCHHLLSFQVIFNLSHPTNSFQDKSQAQPQFETPTHIRRTPYIVLAPEYDDVVASMDLDLLGIS